MITSASFSENCNDRARAALKAQKNQKGFFSEVSKERAADLLLRQASSPTVVYQNPERAAHASISL